MVIFVFGLPASGKSFFASHLADRLKYEYVNSDILRKSMFEEAQYSKEEKRMVYDKMKEIMMEAIHSNQGIVIDATFYKEELRNEFEKQAIEKGETVVFIEVEADFHIIKERLKKKREFSDADLNVYHKIKSEFEPLRKQHLTLTSTQNNIEEMIDKAVLYLENIQDES